MVRYVSGQVGRYGASHSIKLLRGKTLFGGLQECRNFPVCRCNYTRTFGGCVVEKHVHVWLKYKVYNTSKGREYPSHSPNSPGLHLRLYHGIILDKSACSLVVLHVQVCSSMLCISRADV